MNTTERAECGRLAESINVLLPALEQFNRFAGPDLAGPERPKWRRLPTALWMRVVTRDGSRCLFEGLPEGDEIQGGRICFTSHGAIRHGWWRIQRAY
jgi:hypothetical protein